MTRIIGASLIAAMLFGVGSAAAEGETKRDWLRMRSVTGLPSTVSRMDLDAPAGRRYAVVIGNDKYENAPPLENARADARAMALLLRRQGFLVDERYNLDKRGFEDLMRQALFELSPDSEVLFFFAGHGIQIGRRNYLLPVDSALSSAYDTPFETITLDSIVKILGARTRRQVFILDSCRNNPFVDARMMTEIDSTLFEAHEGFNPMSAPVNSLVAYSTSPGAVAFDGETENSPFTAAFVRQADAGPGASMRELLGRVRRDVYHETEGQQVPWESSTLVEPFVLQSDPAAAPVVTADGGGRGMVKVAANVVADEDSRGVSLTGGARTIFAPLDRRIALGAALVQALELGAGSTITIDPATRNGQLILEGRTISDYHGEPLTRDMLAGLVYEYAPGQRPATGQREDYDVSEMLRVTPAGQPAQDINLLMRADPCDFEAGDWLDPEGVGLTRYPNEISPERAVQACEAAVRLRPGAGRFHYQLGRGLQALLRYDEARAAFERASELGHTRAWHALGDLAAEGVSIEGGRADTAAPDAALEFYAKGVERGDPYAYHALGKQLLKFGKTDGAKRYGFELLTQSLELGHTFSMNELGIYYLNEKSDHFEPDRGLRHLHESAARKDIYGYNNLGFVYERGLGGVDADPQKALQWYTRAAEGGHPYAPVNIGRMYFSGKFGRADLARAIGWYDEGLARGTAWGGANAAWIIANKRPRGFTIADAALRAAKTAVLRDEGAAKQAMTVLDGVGQRAMDAASQMIVKDFIPEQVVDGLIGPRTKEAIAELSRKYSFDPPPDDPKARLLKLARIYWRVNGVRIDLL